MDTDCAEMLQIDLFLDDDVPNPVTGDINVFRSGVKLRVVREIKGRLAVSVDEHWLDAAEADIF